MDFFSPWIHMDKYRYLEYQLFKYQILLVENYFTKIQQFAAHTYTIFLCVCVNNMFKSKMLQESQ